MKELKVKYKMITSPVTIDGKEYTTYGIEGETVRFDDVSLDRDKVRKMVETVNEVGLEECHLADYIYDSLI